MDEERTQKIGAVSGMVHALGRLKLCIGYIDNPYRPINPRHTRKMAARAEKIAPIREAYALIEKDLRELQAHLAETT